MAHTVKHHMGYPRERYYIVGDQRDQPFADSAAQADKAISRYSRGSDMNGNSAWGRLDPLVQSKMRCVAGPFSSLYEADRALVRVRAYIHNQDGSSGIVYGDGTAEATWSEVFEQLRGERVEEGALIDGGGKILKGAFRTYRRRVLVRCFLEIRILLFTSLMGIYLVKGIYVERELWAILFDIGFMCYLAISGRRNGIERLSMCLEEVDLRLVNKTERK